MDGFYNFLAQSFLIGGIVLAALLFIVKSEGGLMILLGVGIIAIVTVIVLILRGKL